MKKQYEKHLKDVLGDVKKDLKVESKLLGVQIEKIWTETMGATIGSYTRKLFVKHKTLFLYVDSSALKHELTFSKEQVINKLNDALGSELIEEIRFL